MYFLTQFVKFDGSTLVGRCYGVVSDESDVNFNTLSSRYSVSVDFRSGSFSVGSYLVSLKGIDESFIAQAIATKAYLCLDCDYDNIYFF